MMKTELTFDRFLEIFVPGAILTIGTWYLHRPFLMVYFPAVASDTAILDTTGSTLGAKALIFFIAAICVGVLVNYMWDVTVVCLVNDAADSDKSRRCIRRLIRWLARPFVFIPADDPRVHAVSRYLHSSRKELFVKMMHTWAATGETALTTPSEAVLAHQHIISRLKVTSQDTRTVLMEIYRPVLISGSVFLVSALLVPIALLSFLTARAVQLQVTVHPWFILLAITLGMYLFAVLSCYSLRRHLRHFCSQSLTLALHRFMTEKKTEKEAKNEMQTIT